MNVTTFSTATPTQTANDLEMEWKKLQADCTAEADSEPQQLVLIRKCLWTIIKKEGVALTTLTQELDEYVHDIWIHVANRFLNKADLIAYINLRNQAGKSTISLLTLICMSVKAVLEREKRNAKRATEFLAASLNDETFCNDLIDVAALHKGGISVEDEACLRQELLSLWNKANDIDKKILVLLSCGYTEREIGRSVGLTNPHNRIVKIRETLESAGMKNFL